MTVAIRQALALCPQHDPLSRTLDLLRGRSAALGASFQRHLQTERCMDLPHPPACSGHQLVRTLETPARQRDRPARFAVICRRLAIRWHRQGACAAHCDAAGAALLRSLRDVLGSDYEEAEEQWAAFYGHAAEAMLVVTARHGPGDWFEAGVVDGPQG